MPIYAYQCEACGFEKDALQKLSDAPLTHCTQCGQDTLRKQVTAAGFQLKGSGWYVTDFKGDKKVAAKDAAASSGASASSDTPAGPSAGTASPAVSPSPAAVTPSADSSAK